jgi:hypothetical protein
MKPAEEKKSAEGMKPAEVMKSAEGLKPAEAMKPTEARKTAEEKMIVPRDPPDAKYTITGRRIS